MEEKIKVNLSTDHIFECTTNIIGREGEGNTSKFEITIPEKLCSCSVYLDFAKPNGEKLRTPKLKVENGVAYYDVVPYLLTDEGEIKVQAVLVTEIGGVWKSTIKKYTNYDSINAMDSDYPEREDFITEAQRVLDELSREIEAIAEILSNDKDFADAIINRVEELNNEEIDKLKIDVDELHGSVGSLRNEVGTLENRVEDVKKELNTPIQKNEGDIANLNRLFTEHRHDPLYIEMVGIGSGNTPITTPLLEGIYLFVYSDTNNTYYSGVGYIKRNEGNDNDYRIGLGVYTLSLYENDDNSFDVSIRYTSDYPDKLTNLAISGGTLTIYRIGVINYV